MVQVTFIWDLDGTLLDSYEAILAGIQETYEYYKIPFDRDKVKDFILRQSVQELLVNDAHSYGLDSKELNHFRAKSLAEKNTSIRLLDGAREVLDWTVKQGIQNFIYTHKSDNTFQILEDLGIASYFTEVLTSDSGFARKPNPEALLYLIEKYDLDRKNTYYIGDRILDVQTAQAARIGSINLNINGFETNHKIEHLQEIKDLSLN